MLMLKLRRVTEIYDMKVFTDTGDYFGDIEEVMISKNRISGWRVKSTKNSYLNKVLGSARGVIVPHALVKSIGDVMIISKSAMPSGGEDEAPEAAA
jgi:sporulation protein YlmC with PRC-barrel domain